ncbi:MAG: SDR family NAD(P)-dependent oxidoreductase [Salinibacterium sp.]|nr:SDR family NAD(P)-dependent oxidoreductase [Salinibacterium sp.]
MEMSTPLAIAITGANSGIGLRATTRLAAAGHTVFALCRDVERSRETISAATAGAPNVEIIHADLSDPESILRASADLVARGPLDSLINNAAVFDLNQKTAAFTPGGHEVFWATNHLGPFELTARLSPALAQSSRPRVVFVASKGLVVMPRLTIRFDDLDSPTWYSPTKAYYHAKLAQVMTAVSLAEKVPNTVRVTCIRVPAVRLDAARIATQPRLMRALYAPKNATSTDPDLLGATYERAATRDAASSELYLNEDDKPVALPAAARDVSQRERLWTITQEVVGSPTWAW